LKRHIVIIYILLMATSSAFSQDEYITTGMRDLIGQVDWIKRTQPGTSTIEGSPYLNDDFIDGTIYYDKKYKIDKVPLRLNLYNGDMEFKEKNTTMAIADPSRINKIVMGAYTFIYLPENKKGKVGGFVRMWNTDFPSVMSQKWKPTS
jgi:hypothetical protein